MIITYLSNKNHSLDICYWIVKIQKERELYNVMTTCLKWCNWLWYYLALLNKNVRDREEEGIRELGHVYWVWEEKTQILDLTRHYDLKCKFFFLKKRCFMLAISTNQISFFPSCFYTWKFSHLHIPRSFPFHLKTHFET